jgi:hypothetical protein
MRGQGSEGKGQFWRGEIRMTRKMMVVSVVALGCVIGLVAQQQQATEAPAGFATPALIANPGSQSVSNGLAEPTGDTFAHD